MKRRRTPAATKICAAMAIDMFRRCVLQTRRIVQATIRAMQKPNSMPDMMNFWPRRWLTWRIVMCIAAPMIKRTRKMEVIGSSRVVVGVPPRPAAVGR